MQPYLLVGTYPACWVLEIEILKNVAGSEPWYGFAPRHKSGEPNLDEQIVMACREKLAYG